MTTETTPEVGQPAPVFTLPTTGGESVTLEDFKGKQAVVLYFYPEDDTSGCTKEACAFRDLRGQFADAGAAILGVSPDNVDSHEKFAGKYSLNFPLLADEGARTAKAYGAWGEKTSYGKTTIGLIRTTFVIDRQGIIRKVFPKVKVDQHADDVLEVVRGLS